MILRKDMKKTIILMSLTILVLSIKAQTISGNVYDEGGEPIAYASVSLIQSGDSTLMTGTTTGTDGHFEMQGKKEATILRVSYLGYSTQYLNPDSAMHVVMKEEGLTVDDVVVTGHRPIYKMEGSTLKASVQGSLLSKLGNADDVLEQLPFITKNDGNYSIIGRGTPLIYINNRLVRNNDELRAIRSQDIKSVDIELTPSSRYSAEVGAVIKIATLRLLGDGFGGQFASRLEQNALPQYVNNASLNYRRKGFDLIVTGTYGIVGKRQHQRDHYMFLYDHKPFRITEEGILETKGMQQLIASSEANYIFSDKHQIGIRYSFDKKLRRKAGSVLSGNVEEGDIPSIFSIRGTDRTRDNGKNLVNAYCKNELLKSWQLNLDATWMESSSELIQQSNEDIGGHELYVGSKGATKSELWALRIWNTHKMQRGMLEWGSEISKTRNSQNYLMENADIAEFIPSSENVSRQKALTLFADLSYKLGAFHTSMSLRYEHVDLLYEADGHRLDDVSRIYNRLFPTVSVFYSSNSTHFNLSYRTIVSRPTYFELRNTVQYNSSFAAQKGNPNLHPTYMHRLALTMSHRDLYVDLSYNIQKDVRLFTAYLLAARPMVMADYTNHDMNTYQATVYYSPTVRFWKPAFTASVFGQQLHFQGKSYSGVGLFYNWDNLLTLPKQWTIIVALSGNTNYTNQAIWQHANFKADASVRKTMGNWQLTLGANDIFNTHREQWEYDINGVHFDKWDNHHSQSIYVRAIYTFNPAKTRYRGGNSGKNELERL